MRDIIFTSGVVVAHVATGSRLAVEMSREGISLIVIQRQLQHADLGVSSSYLRGIVVDMSLLRLMPRQRSGQTSVDHSESGAGYMFDLDANEPGPKPPKRQVSCGASRSPLMENVECVGPRGDIAQL